MLNSKKLIVSLTTYPARFEYLKKAFSGILGQTAITDVDSIIINIDDNLQQDQICAYDEFKALDSRIEVKIRDHRWKSANKLVWTYKDNPDAIIVCFDDDKAYPSECLAQLVEAWKENPDCIIAQEVNPAVFLSQDSIGYLNGMDIKLMQREWGKYLSNACLFPPNCFTDELYDYELFQYVTQGNHDELWFWIVSTLAGVQCIGLNNTYSYQLDEATTFEHDAGALSHINADPAVINGYNMRLNEKFGSRLLSEIDKKPVQFRLSKDNVLAFGSMVGLIQRMYGAYRIELLCDHTMVKSWMAYLVGQLRNFQWRDLKIKTAD